MRIGFFTDSYLPSGFGTETSIETFRRSLEKKGYRVWVFAPHFPGYRDKNPRVFRFYSLKTIKKPEMRLAFPFLPVNNLKKILDLKLDIAHAHTPFSMGFLGKFIAEQQKIPLIYTHHTHYPEYAKFYIGEKILLPRLAKTLIVRYSNLTDAVIAPSFKMKVALKSYGVKKPIHILPTGINLRIFKKSPTQKKKFRKRLGIDPETKVLLYVGRMGEEKNVSFLLKVFKEVLAKTRISVILLMVGSGPDLDKFQELETELKIGQFVNFAGPVPYQEISKFYQASDIFIFASLTDTQGIVILEAIACGLPVVALKDDAFKEFVIQNKNGFLIKKPSTEIFAQKVLELLHRPSLYKKFSNQALQLSQNFSEANQAEKLIGIYKALLKK